MFNLYKTNFYLRSSFCNPDYNEQNLPFCKNNAHGLAIYIIILKAVLKPEKDKKFHS